MQVHTERGLDRLVNFSDAVVAVAITLLALPLVDMVSEAKNDGVLQMLGENYFKISAFVLSFVIIARFWMVHHRVFENVRDYSGGLIWANIAWLLTIVVFPFATELITGMHSDDGWAVGIYIGAMMVSMALMALQIAIINRSPALKRDGLPDLSPRPSLIVSGLFGVALVVAVLVPQIGLWALCLLFLADPVGRIAYRIVPPRDGRAASLTKESAP